MKTAADALSFSIRGSGNMLAMMCADLSGADWTCRPVPAANCAAWTVGHLVLVDHGALKRVGVTDAAPLPEGFDTRFGMKENAPAATDFGDTSILIPTFLAQRTRFADAVAAMAAEAIEAPLEKPHPRFKTMGEFLAFMSLHVMLHTGQISTIRRCLGRPALF